MASMRLFTFLLIQMPRCGASGVLSLIPRRWGLRMMEVGTTQDFRDLRNSLYQSVSEGGVFFQRSSFGRPTASTTFS